MNPVDPRICCAHEKARQFQAFSRNTSLCLAKVIGGVLAVRIHQLQDLSESATDTKVLFQETSSLEPVQNQDLGYSLDVQCWSLPEVNFFILTETMFAESVI